MRKHELIVKVLGTLLISLTLGCNSKVDFSTIPMSKNELPINESLEFEKVEMTFHQKSENGKVDVLFVVDNSPSMYEEQSKVGSRFGDFMSELSDTDWQIGFINTDMITRTHEPGWGGRLYEISRTHKSILTPDMGNSRDLFLRTIDRSGEEQRCWNAGFGSSCATSTEEPLKAIIAAVKSKHAPNKSFFRRGASLAVVILSDEDEQSSGPSSATRPVEVIREVRKELGVDKKFHVYGMIIQPGDSDCLASQAFSGGQYGDFAQELVSLTGGLSVSICSNDYSQALQDMSTKVKKNLLLQEVVIGEGVVKSSVEVSITPYAPVEWTVERDKVKFKRKPPEGSKVVVKFRKRKKKKKDSEKHIKSDNDEIRDKEEREGER